MDTHRRTAAEMWGIPEDEVTPEQRSAAQAVNFMSLYGGGTHTQAGKLSDEVHVRIAEKLGANSATCIICGVTTHHRRQDGVFVQVAAHRETCQRGPNLQNIPRPTTEDGTRFMEMSRKVTKR